MDKLLIELMKNDKDVNEVLNMPYYYVVEILREQNQSQQEKSLISTFGG